MLLPEEMSIPVLDGSSDEESEYDRSLSDSLELKGLVVSGEAPESDVEDEAETVGEGFNLKEVGAEKSLVKERQNVRDSCSPSVLKSMDPYKYKRQIERNKSLFKGLSDSFVERLVTEETKRLEKLSQNLSNSQMQMQEALLQARIGTGNLLRLQMELANLAVSGCHLQGLREVTGKSGDSTTQP